MYLCGGGVERGISGQEFIGFGLNRKLKRRNGHFTLLTLHLGMVVVVGGGGSLDG